MKGQIGDSVSWFSANAASVVEQYESLEADRLHAWLLDLLPAPPAAVLDVGAGSGRDATWLAGRGYAVVASEPASAMRAEAARLHPGLEVQWVDDALPDLPGLCSSGKSFELVMLNAVWMYVAVQDRPRAFASLAKLVRPGGLMAFSLRQGPEEPQRGLYAAGKDEIVALADGCGAQIKRSMHTADLLGRREISWEKIAVRLP